MNIGFIGNFTVPYTTENERKWSFERLGHTVIPFQENECHAVQLMEAINIYQLDLLMYSHTHGWEIPNLKDVLNFYSERGVPTASAHLDRWAGLARQSDMGKEATWFTKHIFMADASPEAVKLYQELGLNWHWLKPGVVEKDCYMSEPDIEKYPHEIIFVGSRGYHPEYPWRPYVIDYLKKTYGDRFGHYGNDGIRVVRQHELNQLYASAKIVVGDSCFAGEADNYWSDRIPETTGRGGFLIHPKVKGCDHKGVAWFEPGSIADLHFQIEKYLQDVSEREGMRREGHLWTKQHRTYTHLAQEILDIIAE